MRYVRVSSWSFTAGEVAAQSTYWKGKILFSLSEGKLDSSCLKIGNARTSLKKQNKWLLLTSDNGVRAVLLLKQLQFALENHKHYSLWWSFFPTIQFRSPAVIPSWQQSGQWQIITAKTTEVSKKSSSRKQTGAPKRTLKIVCRVPKSQFRTLGNIFVLRKTPTVFSLWSSPPLSVVLSQFQSPTVRKY